MTFQHERRRSGWPGGLLLRAGLAWVLISLLLLATHAAGIAARRFPDPDDILRLVQVRDLLAGQSWFDLTQYRLDAPNGGVAMHWSRLVDIPLVLTILALTPLVGAATAETIALVVVPLLTLLCAVLLVARLAWRVLGEEEAGLSCLVMALSVPLLFQFAPLRVDHHGWQVVCALLAANGLTARSSRKGGTIVGLALAAWLAISVEALPMIAAFCALLALRWLRDDKQRVWLAHTLQALVAGSLALFALTRGFGDLGVHCDALSPPHLAILGWAAFGATVLAARHYPFVVVLGGFALIGGGALGIALLTAPQCAAGGFADVDPLVRDVWLSRVMEGRPLWRQDLAVIAQNLVLPVLGLLAALKLFGRSVDWLRGWWIEYALLLLAALATAVIVTRAGAVASALAAVPLGWQLKEWLALLHTRRRTGPRVAAVAALALGCLPALPLGMIGWGAAARADAPSPIAPGLAPKRASDCRIADLAPYLAKQPMGEVAAPLDLGPALLLDTRHSVIASAHHRGHQGIAATIRLFTVSPDEARAMLAERGSAYLALCPGLMETAIYAERNPEGFAARMLSGQVPDWLEPVLLESDTMLLWRITPDGNPSPRR